MKHSTATLEKDKWKNLVNNLITQMTISQGELANLCNVSQQAVSKWTKGESHPGKFAQRQLLKLIEKSSKVDLEKKHKIHPVKINPVNNLNEETNQSIRSKYVKTFLEIAQSLEISELEEVINYAEYRLKSHKQPPAFF